MEGKRPHGRKTLEGNVGGKVWAALKENLLMKGLNEAT